MWTPGRLAMYLGFAAVGVAIQSFAVIFFAQMHDVGFNGYDTIASLFSGDGLRRVGWGYLAITAVGSGVVGWTGAGQANEAGWWVLAVVAGLWAIGLAGIWLYARRELVYVPGSVVLIAATPGHIAGVVAVALRLLIERPEEPADSGA